MRSAAYFIGAVYVGVLLALLVDSAFHDDIGAWTLAINLLTGGICGWVAAMLNDLHKEKIG